MATPAFEKFAALISSPGFAPAGSMTAIAVRGLPIDREADAAELLSEALTSVGGNSHSRTQVHAVLDEIADQPSIERPRF